MGTNDGFQVILTDLQDASDAFTTGGKAYHDIMPDQGPTRADTGEASVNSLLDIVLTEIGYLHSAVASTMQDHGDKLKKAHDNYASVEVSPRLLFDDIVDPNNIHQGDGSR
jgi:hypothetical protein